MPANNTLVPSLLTSEPEATKTLDTVTATIVTAAMTNPTTVMATTTTTNVARESVKKSLKEEKEPIQIIRGGRVITLPPIEAPATRSKRLQAKVEPAQKTFNTVKRIEKFR